MFDENLGHRRDVIIYFNLTQTAFSRFRKNYRWIYIRSSWIEQRHYRGLLWSVPDEMLLHLATGRLVKIVDVSTHRRGKVERIFVPTLRALLEYIWLNQKRRLYCQAHLDSALAALKEDNSLKARYIFWKDLAKDLIREVNIEGLTYKVDREYTKEEIFDYFKSMSPILCIEEKQVA